MSAEDDSYDEPAPYNIAKDKLRYEMTRAAASKLAQHDPNAQQVARSSSFEHYRRLRRAATIGANLLGLKRIPLSMRASIESVRLRGTEERMRQMDPLGRLLLSVGGLRELPQDKLRDPTDFGADLGEDLDGDPDWDGSGGKDRRSRQRVPET